jgi:hypothetical protein
VNAVRRELLVQAELAPASVSQQVAEKVTDLALNTGPATQVRRPWRSTVRTAFQVLLGVVPMVPLIVDASGVDKAAPAVAGALAISSGAARVMALPAVELFLQRFVPWLAAAPAAPEPEGA